MINRFTNLPNAEVQEQIEYYAMDFLMWYWIAMHHEPEIYGTLTPSELIPCYKDYLSKPPL